MAEVSVPVGKTEGAGWEIGVSKTLGFGVDEVWSVLRKQQRKHWQAAMERLELAIANSLQTCVR
ncbi:hypothetical protein JGU71_07730 [Antrihabitans sp. YC3-6]|uniref:Uncharacterized protein n=1 Tax=Antrihabitans stalagmiti TaxID=2799499 RepID=A0A934NP11_9NOCA|nr:hypothetical protein [Antrihabitans stalagmiti]MBJ8338773.1 hypothetical protein [Antrihabitans stalagmiti]